MTSHFIVFNETFHKASILFSYTLIAPNLCKDTLLNCEYEGIFYTIYGIMKEFLKGINSVINAQAKGIC